MKAPAITLAIGLAICLSSLTAAATKSPVADAVMNRDHAALRTFLQQKADVNAPQVDGATALHWAVYHDDGEAVDALVAAGAKVDAANREGVTPLMMASLFGDPAIITKLIKAGADPKQRGRNGETMVMFAARNGNPDAIKLLIDAGADVNAKETIRGTTALMWAVDQRHPAAVKMLLQRGADFSAKSGPAGLPRNYMAQRVNTTAVDAAKRRYAAAAAAGRTYEEQLAFEQANGTTVGPRGFDQVVQQQQREAQQQLQQQQARSQQPSAAGAPAQAGAGQGNAGRGGAVARQAPAVTSVNPDADQDDTEVVVAGLVGSGGGGLTPLIFAAREGDLESARYLLEAGADINQASEYGWTPLLTATNNRHYKLATYLLEQDADPNIPNKGGWTPLYLATDNRNIEGGDYPVPKADLDSLEFIRTLLDYGADVDARVKDNTLTRTIFTMQWLFEDGATAFLRAAQSSDVALMKLLLEYGADPKIPSNYGDTALSVAAGIGWVEGVTYEWSKQANVEAIKLLLDLGLDPNSSNRDGRTPLMGAAIKGRNDVVQLLVDHGAKLETRDHGSRDTDKVGSLLAGHTWQALDYADGLVRVGVQSAVNHPDTAALIRKLMTDRGLPVPPPNRVVDSICIVEICQERTWK
jgi:ankyrin repeat protein